MAKARTALENLVKNEKIHLCSSTSIEKSLVLYISTGMIEKLKDVEKQIANRLEQAIKCIKSYSIENP